MRQAASLGGSERNVAQRSNETNAVVKASTKSAPAKPLTPSLEDYLKTILFLSAPGRVARVRDVAKRLGVGMSSVTAALHTLSERALVNYDPYQVIILTDRGREIAEKIRGSHQVLKDFLTDVLCLDEQQADANACRMEHAVDDEVVERLGALAAFLHGRDATKQWCRDFRKRCRVRSRRPAKKPHTVKDRKRA